MDYLICKKCSAKLAPEGTEPPRVAVPVSLADAVPNAGELVFVFDGCWGAWFHGAYEGKDRKGKHVFSLGFDRYGCEKTTDDPTHFLRYILPVPEVK